jgi:hypothetical protein
MNPSMCRQMTKVASTRCSTMPLDPAAVGVYSNHATAEHPAGGLMVDLWHAVWGGIPYSVVAALPGRYVFAVELDDHLIRSWVSASEDTLDRRRRAVGYGVPL